jgi:polyhydroxybutyrate depolymerase
MKSRLYFILLPFLCALFALNAECRAQLLSKTIDVNGVTRSYLHYLPQGLNVETENPGLMVILHGLTGNSAQMAAGGFEAIADTARVIAIYPQGLTNLFGATAWNCGILGASTADDLSFMHLLIDSAIVRYNVNPSRVYFSGFSMGSIMSYHMACAMNDRIAGIGCLAGTMPEVDIQNCDPQYATPVIHMHGTADDVVPYSANPIPTLSLVPATVAFWQNVHACDEEPVESTIPNTADDNITIDRFEYINCATDRPLELWRLNNAGHIYLTEPLNDITQVVEVWKFLNRFSHPNPATVQVGVAEIELSAPRAYPNPANEVCRIDGLTDAPVRIYSITGELVLCVVPLSFPLVWETSALPNGLYLVEQNGRTTKVMVHHP